MMGSTIGNCRDKNYLDAYKMDLANGMTIAVSSWGEKFSTMSWLD